MEHRTERRRALTEADITAIVDEIQERKIFHPCRYDIEPEEFKDIIGFVRGVRNNVKEYEQGLRKSVIKLAVYLTIAGAINFVLGRIGLPSIKIPW